MKVISVEPITVSIPYHRREVSSVVTRDGVTEIIIRATTDDGIVGWGEACSGADAASIEATVHSMSPFVVGRDPWNREAIRADLYNHGLWQFRAMTGNFAYAGIDMALWDICGKAANQPIYRFFGGLRRSEVTYFFYLTRGNPQDIAQQCAKGLDAGYQVFYLKVGIDFELECAMLAAAREALGSGPRLRIDANGAWSLPEAVRNLRILSEYDIEFVEQPVRENPLEQMAELKARSPIPIIANEGLWTEADAYERIVGRVADVFCFSPYWVGSMASFHRLGHLVAMQGLQVCKHTHGELGIAATACQHLLLTLPNIVDGHQQTAYNMAQDILVTPLPIAQGPKWGIPTGAGLGISVDEDVLASAAAWYRREGQYLPYQPGMLRSE